MNNKLFFSAFLALSIISCTNTLNRSKYNKIYSKNLNKTKHERFIKYSDEFVGVKYISPALGEKYLYRFDAFDCVTLIETLIGMTYSSSFEEFESLMLQTRYHDGIRDMQHRKHFFMGDYINSLQQFFESYNEKLINSKMLEKRDLYINKKEWFKAIHKLDYQGENIKYTVQFVPSSKILDNKSFDESILKDNNEFYIVTFIPTDERFAKLQKTMHSDHDCSHLGILIKDHKNKQLILRHASSEKKQIVDVDFYDYLKEKQHAFKGVSFFVIK